MVNWTGSFNVLTLQIYVNTGLPRNSGVIINDYTPGGNIETHKEQIRGAFEGRR